MIRCLGIRAIWVMASLIVSHECMFPVRRESNLIIIEQPQNDKQDQGYNYKENRAIKRHAFQILWPFPNAITALRFCRRLNLALAGGEKAQALRGA